MQHVYLLVGFAVATLGGVAYGVYNRPGTPISLGIMIASIYVSGNFLLAGGLSVAASALYMVPIVLLAMVATLLVRRKGLSQG